MPQRSNIIGIIKNAVFCVLMLPVCAVSAGALIGLALYTFCLATGCLDNRMPTPQVFALVQQNEALLLEEIASGDLTRSGQLEGIHSITKRDSGIVEYYCGGAGFGSATSYRGFYYSPADDVTVFSEYNGMGLIPKGKGYAQLPRYEGDDNTYYTEHITGHFYYYDTSY